MHPAIPYLPEFSPAAISRIKYIFNQIQSDTMATFKSVTQFISDTKARFADVNDTIKKIKNNMIPGFDRAQYPNIMDIRPGYKVSGGKIDPNAKAIVFVVDKKVANNALAANQIIPGSINGIPTDVTPASVFEKLRLDNAATITSLLPGSSAANTDYVLDSSSFNFAAALTPAARIPQITYVPPTNVQLDEITDEMSLICHVSPEQGWIQLEKFFTAVSGDLTVGMYDFSAPQIRDALVGIAKKDIPFHMCYDGKPPAGVGSAGSKKDDLSEDAIIAEIQGEANTTFEHVKASLGKNGLWANAYHIKVAVNNQESFWLSSGNWQSSNQPVIDTGKPFSTYLNKNNREWHIIVTNKKLARIYHDFLMDDIRQSKEKANEGIVALIPDEELVFPDFPIVQELIAVTNEIKQFEPKQFDFTAANPLKIQPLLTPNNYMPKIKELIGTATTLLYFQNQYIKVSKTMTDDYVELLTALRDKSKDPNIDFRIILRYEPDARIMKENLVNFGFPDDRVKIQNNCHNKGIIIDGKVVVVGSHNWSNYGVEWNRDASLIIYNQDVCAYYQQVFEYDWDNRASDKLNETGTSSGEDIAGLIPADAQVGDYESLFD